MLALQIIRPRTFTFVEEPDPIVSDDGWILVRLICAMICGSDLPAYNGTNQTLTYPLSPGMFIHECSGEVIKSTSDRFRAGDRVVALPHNEKGLAEYFSAHEKSAVRIPDALDNLETATLIQPLSTVIFAADKLGDVKNLSVTILGGGPIGLMISWVLHLRGAGPIYLIEPIPARCKLAEHFGVCSVLTTTSTEARALERSQGLDWPEADICVEAVGHNQAPLNDAISLVREGGRILALGVPDHSVYALEYESLFRKNIHLITSVTPDWERYLEEAAELVLQYEGTLEFLITHRFNIRKATTAFSLFEEKEDGACKVVLIAEKWKEV